MTWRGAVPPPYHPTVHPPRRSWLIPSTLLAIAALSLLRATPVTERLSDPLSRVAVLGASVSDGFGVRLRASLPDGRRPTARVDLADLLEAASRDGSVHAEDLATDTYFLKPEATAARTVAAALEARPTLVIAVDWLFWNAYGVQGVNSRPVRACEDRTTMLDAALDRLEPLAATGVPIVLGDLPDMHVSIEGGMLLPGMVPSAECLAELNARVHDWADRHPNVALAPLADMVRCTLAKDPVRACGQEWSEHRLGPLMQKDRLHPSLAGSMAVLALALETADRVTPQPVSSRFDLDPEALRQRLLARIVREADADGEPDDGSAER